MMDDKLTAFGRALRIRRRVFLWITAAGLLGLAVCLGLLPGSLHLLGNRLLALLVGAGCLLPRNPFYAGR